MELKENESSVLSENNLPTENHSVNNEVLTVIYRAMAELNVQLSKNQRLEPSLDTALFGESGTLDSMTLANFIVITEQMLEERFGSKIDLTQDDPFSSTTGHFRTVGSLVVYVSDQLQR